MASWKLGTCACRVPGGPTPYPYFKALAPSSSSQFAAGDLIKIGFNPARLFLCLESTSRPDRIDASDKFRELDIKYGFFGTDLSFRFGGFPIVPTPLNTVGALWNPPGSPVVRRIIAGGSNDPFGNEWEFYRDGRANFPDNSRPLSFKTWKENTEWKFFLNPGSPTLNPNITPNWGRQEREYRYTPESGTEIMIPRLYLNGSTNAEPTPTPPPLTGVQGFFYGSRMLTFPLFPGNNSWAYDFDIGEQVQTWTIWFNDVPETRFGRLVVTQTVSVSDEL